MKYLENGIEVEGKFYSLEEITDSCNKLKVKNNKLVILKIEWGGGRAWDGATEKKVYSEEVALRVKELMLDKQVYFGEIAGKHSEICGQMEEGDFEIIKDSKKVQKFLADFPSGWDYNHSFLWTFAEQAEGDEYENMTDEEVEEFKTIY